MEIVLVTQEDPFYLPFFFIRFFSRLDDTEISVSGSVLLSPFDESRIHTARRMLNFYGLKNFSKLLLRYGFRLTATWFGIRNYTVKSILDSHEFPVRLEEDVNSSECIDWLSQKSPDVILSAAAPQKFGKTLLRLPNWGCLNVHGASLPKYRGMMPTFWALYNGDEQLGITVHRMAEEFDKGEKVRETKFSIKENASLESVLKRSKELAADLAVESLLDIQNNEVTLTPITGDGEYFSFPKRKHALQLRRKGHTLL